MLSRIFVAPGALVVGVWACVALSNPTQGQPKNVPTPAPTPTRTPRPDQTAVVEGRVFDAKTKTPIVGAEVTLEGRDDLFETTTDAQGKYRFPHVTPGDECAYAVGASGYSTRSSYGASDYAEPQNLTIPASGIRLDFPMLRRATLGGQVRDSAGRPIKGAHVWVETADDVLTTDANGKWSVSTLKTPFPGGIATVEVNVFDPRFSQVETRAKIRPFDKPGDETRLALVMPARAIITGQLTKRGKPLAHALVMVDKEEGMGFMNDSPNFGLPSPNVATDKNGRYRLLVSAPATLQLTLGEDDSVWQTVKVHTHPGQTVVLNRDLKPFPYGSISGRVVNLRGRPVQGASIELWTKNTSETEPVAVTGKDGRFRVAKVAPFDDYHVSVAMPGADYRGGVSVENVRVRSYRTTNVLVRGDTVAPQLQLISPPRVLRGTVPLQYKASDNQGLYASHIEVDGGWIFDHNSTDVGFEFERDKLPRKTSGTWKLNSREFTNGRHRLRVEINDRVGNKAVREWFVWIQNTGAPKPKPTPTPRSGRTDAWQTGNAAVVGGSGY